MLSVLIKETSTHKCCTLLNLGFWDIFCNFNLLESIYLSVQVW